jgi:hypothetical protein
MPACNYINQSGGCMRGERGNSYYVPNVSCILLRFERNLRAHPVCFFRFIDEKNEA